MAMAKSDIVERICNEFGFTKKQSVEILESLLQLMKSSLGSGVDILVSGFGKFCVREKAAPKGRNPATGTDLMLGPRRVVTFKCSGKLRDKVNDGN